MRSEESRSRLWPDPRKLLLEFCRVRSMCTLGEDKLVCAACWPCLFQRLLQPTISERINDIIIRSLAIITNYSLKFKGTVNIGWVDSCQSPFDENGVFAKRANFYELDCFNCNCSINCQY